VRPHPDVRTTWEAYAPDAVDRWHGYLEAYQVMPDERLLLAEPVHLTVSLAALISREEARAECARCGEEIFNEREVYLGDQALCRACAGEQYYQSVENHSLPAEKDRRALKRQEPDQGLK
jgi:formylmethanofuran dehydrogenase subunit E